jgi:hypothetical protein
MGERRTRRLRTSLAASQRCPRGQRIHVVAPAHDLAVLNKSDRDKPVIVGGAGLDYLAVDFVFEGHNVTVCGRMRSQRIAALKQDAVQAPIGDPFTWQYLRIRCQLKQLSPAREPLQGGEPKPSEFLSSLIGLFVVSKRRGHRDLLVKEYRRPN